MHASPASGAAPVEIGCGRLQDIEVYGAIASFYEAEYGHLDADVAFYSRHAVRGRLLVLGCGTGRVGRVLGKERDIVGLDRSPAMLDIARQRAPHAQYVQGDMTSFALGEFAEIIIPNGGFNFLATRAAQANCLESCAVAMQPGSPLTLDMPMPDFRNLGVAHSAEKTAWNGEIDELPARRTREVHRYPHLQRIDLIERYYVADELRAKTTLPLRLVFPSEVEWMFENCGFAVESTHGSYDGSELEAHSPRFIVRGIRL